MTGQNKPPRFTDSLANLIGDALGDIREKLVEEAWFGRPVARPDFDEAVKSIYGVVSAVELAPSREIDIDR